MKGKDPILIIGAMNSETELLAAALSESRNVSIGDFPCFAGKRAGKPVVVCRCLIGTVYAAAATALAIERFSPRLVINCGTAGAHNPGLHQGDIVLGQDILNIGRYATPPRDEGCGSDYTQWKFAVNECFDDSGQVFTYSAHSDEKLLTAAESEEYTGGRVVKGTVLSSDAWNREADRILFYHRTLGSDCEDMESFSIAKVCEMFSLPFLALRIISNSELYPDEKYVPDIYGKKVQEFTLNLIDRL